HGGAASFRSPWEGRPPPDAATFPMRGARPAGTGAAPRAASLEWRPAEPARWRGKEFPAPPGPPPPHRGATRAPGTLAPADPTAGRAHPRARPAIVRAPCRRRTLAARRP